MESYTERVDRGVRLRRPNQAECQLIIDGHIVNWKREKILCPRLSVLWRPRLKPVSFDVNPEILLSNSANLNPSAVTSDPIFSHQSGCCGSSDDDGEPELKMKLHVLRDVNIRLRHN